MTPIRRAVVKFGGSTLSSGERFLAAARSIRDLPAAEKLVVVSAPGSTTDYLLGLLSAIPPLADPESVARVLALGEVAAARILAAVLRSVGVNARTLEPDDPAWPLRVSGDPLGASVDLVASREVVRTGLVPRLRQEVVVVCGFVGRDGARLCTLGRGGSDVTATALGALLEADEVLLVKEVPGIFDADPRMVPSARPIPEMHAEELAALARGGAGVVAPEALRYLLPTTRLRVVPFGAAWDDQGGTVVRPPFAGGNVAIRGAEGPVPVRIGSVTVLASPDRRAIDELIRAVAPERWHGLFAAAGAMTVFLDEEEVPTAVRLLHASGRFRGIASRVGLHLVTCDPADAGRGAPPLTPERELIAAARGPQDLRLFLSDRAQTFATPRTEVRSGRADR